MFSIEVASFAWEFEVSPVASIESCPYFTVIAIVATNKKSVEFGIVLNVPAWRGPWNFFARMSLEIKLTDLAGSCPCEHGAVDVRSDPRELFVVVVKLGPWSCSV